MEPRRRDRLVPARRSRPRRRAAPGARPQPRSTAASRRCIARDASRRGLPLGDRRRSRQLRLRLPAPGRGRRSAGPGRLQHDAGAAPRLPHRRAAAPATGARSPTPIRDSTAAATWATTAASSARRPIPRTASRSRSMLTLPPPRDHHAAGRRLNRWRRCPDRLLPGSPYPLGATWDGLGINFAVFSANAAAHRALPVRSGRPARDRALRAARMHRRGLARLPARRAARPDLRLSRPRPVRAAARPSLQPAQAAARSLCAAHRRRHPHWSDALFGYRVNSPRADLSFDRRDSAPGDAARAWWSTTTSTGATTGRPTCRGRDTVIYEAHLRGPHACCAPDLRPRERGTFAALADPGVIEHLRRLGVTAVELLPVHAFVQDRHLLRAGPAQLLGLQHARLLRARAALPRRRHRSTRCASRCAACTPPASR